MNEKKLTDAKSIIDSSLSNLYEELYELSDTDGTMPRSWHTYLKKQFSTLTNKTKFTDGRGKTYRVSWEYIGRALCAISPDIEKMESLDNDDPKKWAYKKEIVSKLSKKAGCSFRTASDALKLFDDLLSQKLQPPFDTKTKNMIIGIADVLNSGQHKPFPPRPSIPLTPEKQKGKDELMKLAAHSVAQYAQKIITRK